MLRTVMVIKLHNGCRLWLCCLEHNPQASGTFREVKVRTILFAEVRTQASVLSSGGVTLGQKMVVQDESILVEHHMLLLKLHTFFSFAEGLS